MLPQNFPKKRHALYGEALDVLLRKWAAEKRIQLNPIYQELSIELELNLLSEIAFKNFINNQIFFDKRLIVSQIKSFLIENLSAPGYLDADKVLKEIEIQQGILVERARGAYSFSHLTFQEYLTATFMVDNRKVGKILQEYILDERWREIFLLTAGLMPGRKDCNNFFLFIEKRSQIYLNEYSKLLILIKKLEKVTAHYINNSKALATKVHILHRAIYHCYHRNYTINVDLALEWGIARCCWTLYR